MTSQVTTPFWMHYIQTTRDYNPSITTQPRFPQFLSIIIQVTTLSAFGQCSKSRNFHFFFSISHRHPPCKYTLLLILLTTNFLFFDSKTFPSYKLQLHYITVSYYYNKIYRLTLVFTFHYI